MPFKMHKIILFPEKKCKKKIVCLPYLKFSDLLPETHLFFYLASCGCLGSVSLSTCAVGGSVIVAFPGHLGAGGRHVD